MENQQFVQIMRRTEMTEDEFYALVPYLNKVKYDKLLPQQFPLEDLSTKVAESIVTPPDAPVPDCLTCGGCCNYFLCVAVADAAAEVPRETYWEVKRGDIVVDRFMRRDPETLSCVALNGEVGGHNGCTIYENRPNPCRSFEAGSDRCHGARRAFGIEPPLSAMEMYLAKQKLKANSKNDDDAEEISLAMVRELAGTKFHEIVAQMPDESIVQLHIFDPNKEAWGQSEFFGMKLSAAREMINVRSNAAAEN